MEVFGTTLWAGWPMCAVVVWRGFAAAFVARLKLPLGKVLHNKVIHADAAMNKADWLTSVSTVVGLLGTGLGFWWADAVAAAVISTDILKDGYTHLKSAVSDLIDRIPETIESGTEEPINAKVKEYIESQDWIEKSIVRLHEQGNFFFGEAYVVPKSEDGLIQKIDKALHDIRHMDWRMRDFAMTPVPAHELSSHETDHRNRK
jgi:divalent metal cation (Fe/Co/Zn/Cd) transporter